MHGGANRGAFVCVDLCGVFYRWIFRHVLHFLRDGAIPDDPPLLQELYGHTKNARA